MDPTTLAIGVASSLITQVIKRENAGSLENILLAGGMGYGATLAGGLFGLSPDVPMTLLASYAWHGLTSDQRPMQALKLAATDRLLEAVGRLFSLASSRKAPPA